MRAETTDPAEELLLIKETHRLLPIAEVLRAYRLNFTQDADGYLLECDDLGKKRHTMRWRDGDETVTCSDCGLTAEIYAFIRGKTNCSVREAVDRSVAMILERDYGRTVPPPPRAPRRARKSTKVPEL
jgi:hypothetical protein